MVSAPLPGVSEPTETAASTSSVLALHLAVSRSAAVRLSSVAAALAASGAPQALADLGGERALETGAPPHAPAAAATTGALEAAIERTRPAWVVVAGDGDAAVEAALTAHRLGVPIARLGAGLRCGDRAVESEINRMVLDELAALLLADGEQAVANLREEGAGEERIRCVGSTVPDSIRRWHASASRRRVRAAFGVGVREYVLVSLNKRENVGDGERLARVVQALGVLARRLPVIVCLRPELCAMLERDRALAPLRAAGAIVTRPLGYLDFLALQSSAGAVLTDSAAVQEETTVLGVPCFTLGRSSERTLTLTHGTNLVLGDDPAEIAELTLGGLAAVPEQIPLWGGGAGRRVAAELLAWSPA
jgi:UDP-N-acetylglucosamine 2-epimerase (non-hydrolysing)